MSRTETHFGKLKKVSLNNQSIEDWCKAKLSEVGMIELLGYSSWQELFRDEFHNKYFFNKNCVWEVIEHMETDDNDIYHLSENADGTLTFVMSFYNGGTCLSECIEEKLEELK